MIFSLSFEEVAKKNGFCPECGTRYSISCVDKKEKYVGTESYVHHVEKYETSYISGYSGTVDKNGRVDVSANYGTETEKEEIYWYRDKYEITKKFECKKCGYGYTTHETEYRNERAIK